MCVCDRENTQREKEEKEARESLRIEFTFHFQSNSTPHVLGKVFTFPFLYSFILKKLVLISSHCSSFLFILFNENHVKIFLTDSGLCFFIYNCFLFLFSYLFSLRFQLWFFSVTYKLQSIYLYFWDFDGINASSMQF